MENKTNYKRNANIPMSGFTAGPCLLKDTMQLSSFYDHNFLLGHSAMSINEGIPKFIIDKLSAKYNLKKKVVGILGLAFKAETDDIRDSTSIIIGNELLQSGAKIIAYDPKAMKNSQYENCCYRFRYIWTKCFPFFVKKT